MSISASSIMSKVEAWSKTPEGKRCINAVVKKYRKDGRKYTAAGSRIIDEFTMQEAARKFIATLCNTASGMGLPESVMEHFDSLDYSLPIRQHDGSMVIYVFFKDDLSRASLMPQRYGGVNNIIAVLNNGYSEHESMAKVWGEWHGNRIHALTQRTGLRFVQKAVDEFNRVYGMEYNVVADESNGIYAQ